MLPETPKTLNPPSLKIEHMVQSENNNEGKSDEELTNGDVHKNLKWIMKKWWNPKSY